MIIEFVAVIACGVVTRGDHDARAETTCLDDERHEWRGKGTRHLQHTNPSAEQHHHDLIVEFLRTATSVAADHDTLCSSNAGGVQPRDHTLRGAANGVSVHPRRSGHLGPAKTRGSKPQGGTKETPQFLLVVGIEQVLKCRAVALVRLVGDPCPHRGIKVVVHSTGTSCASSAPRELAASCPASRTSR